jgi:hypothetical protein
MFAVVGETVRLLIAAVAGVTDTDAFLAGRAADPR